MARSDTLFLAVGGGNLAGESEILDEIFGYLEKRTDPRIAVMTVATEEPEGTTEKYNGIFRKRGVNHVEMIDVTQREDSFAPSALKKIERADAIFFTGGDQKNITGLMGGTPLDNLLHKRMEDGVLIAGTSAGAAMMSDSMITAGRSGMAPRVGCVTIAPGMGMVGTTIIDTHFSQRGRHGRLLTAVAHHPQLIGVGLDEDTGILVQGNEFRVVGSGSVTVIDASKMDYSDLVYKKPDEPVGMFDVCVHVLPRGHHYNILERQPKAPKIKHTSG